MWSLMNYQFFRIYLIGEKYNFHEIPEEDGYCIEIQLKMEPLGTRRATLRCDDTWTKAEFRVEELLALPGGLEPIINECILTIVFEGYFRGLKIEVNRKNDLICVSAFREVEKEIPMEPLELYSEVYRTERVMQEFMDEFFSSLLIFQRINEEEFEETVQNADQGEFIERCREVAEELQILEDSWIQEEAVLQALEKLAYPHMNFYRMDGKRQVRFEYSFSSLGERYVNLALDKNEVTIEVYELYAFPKSISGFAQEICKRFLTDGYCVEKMQEELEFQVHEREESYWLEVQNRGILFSNNLVEAHRENITGVLELVETFIQELLLEIYYTSEDWRKAGRTAELMWDEETGYWMNLLALADTVDNETIYNYLVSRSQYKAREEQPSTLRMEYQQRGVEKEYGLERVFEQMSGNSILEIVRKMAVERGGENYHVADLLLAMRDFSMKSVYTLPSGVETGEFMLLRDVILQVPSYEFGRLAEASADRKFEGFALYHGKLKEELSKRSGTLTADILVKCILRTGILSFERKGGVSEYDRIGLGELGKRTVELSKKLRDTVVGQSHAVNAFVEGYFYGRLRANGQKGKKRGPRVTFLFAGPAGVGKTFLAERAAEFLNLPCKRFDMTSYAEEKSYIDLVGSSNRFKNGDKGELTSFVQENPCSMLIIDEIEKAHEITLNLFLQVLDSGMLLDQNLERDVDFTGTILIFTTNAGSSIYEDEQRGDMGTVSADVVYDAIVREKNSRGMPILSAPLMSRLRKGNIILFNRMTAANLIEIVERGLRDTWRALMNTQDITISYDKFLAPSLLYANSGLDARGAAGIAEKFVLSQIYETVRLATDEVFSNEVFDETCDRFEFKVDISDVPQAIRQLYEPADDWEIVIFYQSEGKEEYSRENLAGNVHLTEDIDELKELVERARRVVVLVEYLAFPAREMDSMNIEDVDSRGRNAFELIREKYADVPLYTWVDEGTHGRMVSNEELSSLVSRGSVKSFVTYWDDEDRGNLEYVAACMQKAVWDANYERAATDLAMRHKVLCFSAEQRFDYESQTATVTLTRFHLRQAVESGDTADLIIAGENDGLHWEDIIVSEDVREELEYAVDYLLNPDNYGEKKTNWSVVPRGLIFYGPPGTGKTSIAKALATESGVNFIAVTADSFASAYVDRGAKAIHDIFRKARKYAPCVLFIDEIDAIGRRRGEVTENLAVTLNALLTELDGFRTAKNKPVFVVAATNLGGDGSGDSGLLDPALLRRFDRSIRVDLPDRKCRLQYLKLLQKNMEILELSGEMQENLADRSVAMSFATIRLAVDTAVRMAMRAGTNVTDDVMDEAFERFSKGEKKRASEEERAVALHEAGHALVSDHFGMRPSYLTIVSREGHLGYMAYGDLEKLGNTRDDYLRRVAVLLAGRAAEQCYGREGAGINAGASSDLERATKIVELMVLKLGMYDDLGLRVIGPDSILSEEQKQHIDAKIQQILSQQYEEAVRIITEGEKQLMALSDALVTYQHLNERQIQEYLAGYH